MESQQKFLARKAFILAAIVSVSVIALLKAAAEVQIFAENFLNTEVAICTTFLALINFFFWEKTVSGLINAKNSQSEASGVKLWLAFVVKIFLLMIIVNFALNANRQELVTALISFTFYLAVASCALVFLGKK